MVKIEIEYRDLLHMANMLGLCISYGRDKLFVQKINENKELYGPQIEIPYKKLE